MQFKILNPGRLSQFQEIHTKLAHSHKTSPSKQNQPIQTKPAHSNTTNTFKQHWHIQTTLAHSNKNLAHSKKPSTLK
jgi:hypothetical protein